MIRSSSPSFTSYLRSQPYNFQLPLPNLSLPIINIERQRPKPCPPGPLLQRLQRRRQNPIRQLMVISIPRSQHKVLAARPIEPSAGEVAVADGHNVVVEEVRGVDEEVRDSDTCCTGERLKESGEYICAAISRAVGCACNASGERLGWETPMELAVKEPV